MKVLKVVCSKGRTGFYFDDQRAIKGGAKTNGFAYVGEPVTEGFTSVRQAGESISVMFILEDGQVAYGDCAAVQYSGAGGRDPLFLAEDFIPVIEKEDGSLEGVAAVIDKDFAAELLAEMMEVDTLMILTEVEKVAINFNKPDQQNLDHMTLEEAEKHCADGQFAPGSMLPKVKAAMKFVTAFPEKKAIITSLDKAIDALNEKTGTVVTFK